MFRRVFAVDILVAVVVAPLVFALPAQRTASPIDGAWRHVLTEVAAPDTSYSYQMWGMVVYSGNHFSQMWVRSDRHEVQQASKMSSVEEKVSRFDALIANAGTFELKGDLLIFRREYAKVPAMVGRFDTVHVKLVADTMSMVQTAPWAKDASKMVRSRTVLVRVR